MNCPDCNRSPQKGDRWVTQTKPRFEASVVRGRKCPACGYKWFTAEVPIICDLDSNDRVAELEVIIKNLLQTSYETFSL